jgi:hypothetical protein
LHCGGDWVTTARAAFMVLGLRFEVHDSKKWLQCVGTMKTGKKIDRRKDGWMEGWRDGGMEGLREGGFEGGREGGREGKVDG